MERGQPDATARTLDKEFQDKDDVVDILRLESELARRHDYLHKANLFAERVHQLHDAQDRDEYLEHLEEYSDC